MARDEMARSGGLRRRARTSSGSVADRRSAYLDALHLLARRELSVDGMPRSGCSTATTPPRTSTRRSRICSRPARSTTRAWRGRYARTAVNVKGRGRLRVQRELQRQGHRADVAAEALAEVFGDVDERALVASAIQKRLRGRTAVDRPRASRPGSTSS